MGIDVAAWLLKRSTAGSNPGAKAPFTPPLLGHTLANAQSQNQQPPAGKPSNASDKVRASIAPLNRLWRPVVHFDQRVRDRLESNKLQQ